MPCSNDVDQVPRVTVPFASAFLNIENSTILSPISQGYQENHSFISPTRFQKFISNEIDHNSEDPPASLTVSAPLSPECLTVTAPSIFDFSDKECTCPKIFETIRNWTDSYDIRGEYLSNEDFLSGYNNFLKISQNIPSKRDKSPNLEESPKITFDHNPVTSASYIRTPQNLEFQKFEFRDLDTKNQKPKTLSLITLSQDSKIEKVPDEMLEYEKEDPNHRAAVIDYKTTANIKIEAPKKAPKGLFKNLNGVSFQSETAIIGEDGGVEHFFKIGEHDRNILDDENDEDEVVWVMEPKTEFEKMTEMNTEFNSNRLNFFNDKACLVGVTVRPPSRSTSKDEINQNIWDPKNQDLLNSKNQNHQISDPKSVKIDRELTPAYAPPKIPPTRIPSPPKRSTPDPPPYKNRKPMKSNLELEEKLQRMARDLDACRLEGPSLKPKSATPIPTSSTGPFFHNQEGKMKKSQSALGPSLNLSSSTDFIGKNAIESEQGYGLFGRSSSHERSSSIDVSTRNVVEEQSAGTGKDNRQSRSRFASIRKFLRMPEPTLGGSVRRSHIDSSSTNCSTISSSSNGSITFANHTGTGQHSSLRKFPLFPFQGSKQRTDLSTIRNLFHGANECKAAYEIAQDIDVVVTDITELPSNNNTLVRVSKHASTLGLENGSIGRGSTNGSITNPYGSMSSMDKYSNDITLKGSTISINQLETHQVQVPVPAQITHHIGTTLPPRPPPFASKVKRAAPPVPKVNGESEVNGEMVEKVKIIHEVKESRTLVEKATETTVWRLPTVDASVQTDPDMEIHLKRAPPILISSSISSRASTPQPVCENKKRHPLDDHYDQLVAGHLSALSHLVEHFPSTARQCKRKLLNLGIDATKLKWSDFSIIANSPLLVMETSALYAGILKINQKPEMQSLKVDLMVTPLRYTNPLPFSPHQPKSFFPPIVAEFQEYLPSKLIKLTEQDDDDSECESQQNQEIDDQSILCKISILPRMMVSNIESYADHTSTRHRPHKQPCLHEKEICFIMIQFVSALKYLQSKGIEEINSDLDGFLLLRTVSSRYPQLILCCESFSIDRHQSIFKDELAHRTDLSNNRRFRITLCQGALAALCLLLHTEIPTEELIRDRQLPTFLKMTSYSDGFQKAADILYGEKSHSLTQAKSIFEYMFWVDNEKSEKLFTNEQQAKYWLDKERAKFVCYAVKSLLYFPVDGIMENGGSNNNATNNSISKLDIVDEYRAQFLFNTTSKALIDASVALTDLNVGEILL